MQTSDRVSHSLTFARVVALATAFALVAGVAAVGDPALASDGFWTADETISATELDAFPADLVASPTGEVVSLWNEQDGGSFTLVASIRSASGNWGPPTTISQPDQSTTLVGAVWSSDGDLTVVALTHVVDSGLKYVEVRTRSASGSWSPTITLSAGTSSTHSEHVNQSAAGELMVSWADEATNTIMVRARSAAGVWAAPVALAHDVVSYAYDLALSDSGEATAVWARDTGSTFELESRVRPAGGAWGPVTTLGLGGRPTTVMASNGDVTAIWAGSNGSGLSILRSASRPAGGAWGPTIVLSGGGQAFAGTGDGRLAATATNTSEITVVWQEFETPAFSYQVRARTRSSTGIWGPMETLSTPGQFARPTSVLGTANGAVTAVWEQSGSAIYVERTRSAAGVWGPLVTVVPDVGTYAWLIDLAVVGASNDLIAVWSAYSESNPSRGEIRARPGGGGTWRSTIELSGPECDSGALGNSSPPQVVSTTAGDIVAVWACTTESGVAVHSRALGLGLPLAGVGSAASQDVFAGLAVTSPGFVSFDATSDGLVQTRSIGAPFARPRDSVSGVTALSLSVSGGSLGGVPMGGLVDFARSALGPSPSLPGNELTFIPFARDALTFGVSAASDMPRDIALGNASQDARTVPIFTLRNMYRGVVTSFIDSGGNGVTIRPLLPPVGSETRQWWLDAVGLTEAQLGANVVTVASTEFDGASVVTPGDIVPFSVSNFIAQGNHGQLPAPLAETRSLLVLGQIDTVKAMVRDANDVLTVNPDATISRPVFIVVETARLTGTSASDVALQTMFQGATSTLCSNNAVVGQYGFASIGADCGNTTLYRQGLRLG